MIDQESLSSLTQCTNVQVTNQNPHVQLDCRSLWSFYLEIFQGNDKSETNTFFWVWPALPSVTQKFLKLPRSALDPLRGGVILKIN